MNLIYMWTFDVLIWAYCLYLVNKRITNQNKSLWDGIFAIACLAMVGYSAGNLFVHLVRFVVTELCKPSSLSVQSASLLGF